MKERTVESIPIADPGPNPFQAPEGAPLPPVDNRIIAIALKRCIDDDGYMVEFLDTLSGLLRCNTSNNKVGSAQDAKASMYYASGSDVRLCVVHFNQRPVAHRQRNF